ncbi:hypothetical protein EAL2_808p04760 (plasmid) [Peptoclostridium acidaminophilum DSM 3953]|uniref:UspA domain-containing protein n=1 Tax=Peptoclostridium acidaminophilum DSM 3953 TaxID=1286171 RepID=W8T8E0_PEPAC|nr:universal stress protein [Peptoclostridium acidaminophilum]AHM57979.1 hypothetical protein EAL2_808p04760 [Peptoclostridium acidaminophilum DSM 3953]
MKKILLPVDGSEYSKAASAVAREMAEKFGAEVVVLRVGEPDFLDMYYSRKDLEETVEHKMERIAAATIEEDKKLFEGSTLNVKYVTAVGDAASKILDVCEEEGCDFIVIATHGMGAAKRFLVGSVTNKVVHHSPVPVLVIR